MIALIAAVAVLAVLLFVPAIAVAASRAAVRSVDSVSARIPVEDAATQDRLARIEEAIDAMAAQIERLTQQQQLLVAGRGPGDAARIHPDQHPE